jgi:hypothetical protein
LPPSLDERSPGDHEASRGFECAFNAQAFGDEDHQIVLAAQVTPQASDVQQLTPVTG